MSGRWPRLYIPGQNVGCGSGARLTHVGNAEGKDVTRRPEGKGKDQELSVSLLRDISGSRPENFKTKPIRNGDDRPTQLLSTCFSQLRVWLERVCLLRICPFCTKRLGDLEIFR